MNNEKVLNEILENTKVTKEIIVTGKEKEEIKTQQKKEKAKTAKQKAEAKFTRIGTKLNEDDMQKFNTKLQDLGLNQSQYFKKLIEDDNNIEDLKQTIKDLKEELSFLKNRTFLQKLKNLFS